MMLAWENMFVLNLAYGTAASMRVPSGYSFRLVYRKPPLDTSSQSTTTSTPENRMHPDVFIAVRLFLRRSSMGDAIDFGFASRPDKLPSFFVRTSRLISFHIPEELQFLQGRISSRVAPKTSKSISERESVHTEWHPLHSRWTILAGPEARNCTCQRSADGSRKASP